MDMEGRGYSELYRNTSEEMFIKAMMEGSGGMPEPTMEMLGLKNLSQNIRIDSEELFRTWLNNSENNGCHSTGGIGHHRPPRQSSRRIMNEASLTNQNMRVVQKTLDDNPVCAQAASAAADLTNDLNSTRAEGEKEMQASNLFLAKAWFHSSQPMTRSRSSELRRRYAAMQHSQTPVGIEAMNQASGISVNNSKQEATDINGFNNNISAYENQNQFSAFMSSTNSSSLTFINPQVGCVDKISSVVSMLKGTLERKRLSNNIEKEDSSFMYYSAEEAFGSIGFNQEHGIHAYENQGTFQDVSMLGVTETGVLQKIEQSLMEGIMGSPMNPTPMSTVSREPSQSESSVAPPIVSSGFDMCDDPCISAQASTVCESSMNQMGKGRNQDLRAQSYNNSKQDQKQKGGIIRYGSATSIGSVDRDPTKKRRVERSRKMAEAKERSSTPAIPMDMQSILKRCENLEKEVRSLKLNLSFMNRKDSEQTKQIEELQKQNQEMGEEKEQLLEEIERILADTGNM